MKKCYICGEIKKLDLFYKNIFCTVDGHLNKCKECCKTHTKERRKEKLKDPNYVKIERKKARERARMYKQKPRTWEQTKTGNYKYIHKYPEKHRARRVATTLKKKKGNHLHHWNYSKNHQRDVIELSKKNHYKVHRFLIYDQIKMMYRRIDNKILLDTREKHTKFIEYVIKNMED